MSEVRPDEATVWTALRAIPDPEFGVNIVDLGLIYDVKCADGRIGVTMTLTTESCPAGNWIHKGVEAALAALPGAAEVDVALVFEPRWTVASLSDEACRQLGLERK